jgi:hypothetical protein
MIVADRIIRWSTALAVLGVAAVAAVVSYEHASALVRAHGESDWTGRLIPLTVDGLIYASREARHVPVERRTADYRRLCTVPTNASLPPGEWAGRGSK